MFISAPYWYWNELLILTAASSATRQAAASQDSGAPVRWRVTVLLAVFTGLCGGHNFYLGYPQRGFVQVGLLVAGIATFASGLGLVLLTMLAMWVLAELVLLLAKAAPYSCDAQGYIAVSPAAAYC